MQDFILVILMHTELWWPDGDTNHEGMEIENLFTSLGLSQIISEPTFFLFFIYAFLSRTMTTHAESINSDLQRGLDRHLRHTTLNTEQNQ